MNQTNTYYRVGPRVLRIGGAVGAVRLVAFVRPVRPLGGGGREGCGSHRSGHLSE